MSLYQSKKMILSQWKKHPKKKLKFFHEESNI